MSENRYFDVCIVCALDAEARAFINAAEKWFGAQFQEGYSRNSGPYRHTTLSNHIHEPVTLHLSWLPNTGMVNLALHFKPVLDEFKPHFAGMTGICAGDKSKVKLGDLVIAERAFIGDNGRVTLDEQGHQVTEYDVTTWHTPKNVLHKVRLFDTWRPYVNAIVRPPSKHQQRDWLLNQLLDGQTPSVNDIVRLKRLELEKHAPQWRAIVRELLQGEHPFLTPQRVLRDRSQVDELYFLYDFPYQDPKEAEYNIAPMASVNAIHSDNPFEQIRLPVRQTVAIDLEGAAFYQTVGDMPDMLSLLVKSVSSYADPDKDDTYSTYASTVSAIYMLSFIHEYISSKYHVPLWTRKIQQHNSTKPVRANKTPTTQPIQSLPANQQLQTEHPSKAPFAIFFSYAPEDEKSKGKLEKQLYFLKRFKGVSFTHSQNINAGVEALKEINTQMQQAQIILLFISPDYISSERCYEELQHAAHLHKNNKAHIIPILLRPPDNWKKIPFGDIELGELHWLPARKSVQEISPPDEAYRQIAEGIREVVEKSCLSKTHAPGSEFD